MKAVYEMPKVSFEAFMANDAVSACKGVKSLEFTCVESGKKHNLHTQVFNNIVSWSLIQNGCTNNVGFADYVNGEQGEDSWDSRKSDNVSTSYVDDVPDALNTGERQNQSGFMGWLYFSQNKNDHTVFDSWELEDEDENWRLDYDNEKGILHAWLAPLFYCFNGGTHASY